MPDRNNASLEQHALRTRREASAYLFSAHALRIAPQTLASYAVSGKGPRFMLSGRTVLYAASDIDQWVRSRLKGPFRSTAEVSYPMEDVGRRIDKACGSHPAARHPDDEERKLQIRGPNHRTRASTIKANGGPAAPTNHGGNLATRDPTGCPVRQR